MSSNSKLHGLTPAQIRKFKALLHRRDKLGVKDGERIINIQDGFKVTPMNTMGELQDINYQWYIDEAKKLTEPLWNGAMSNLLS